MIIKLDLNNKTTVQQILDLQKASYLVEAELIQFYDIPTLKDTMESIQECDEVFCGLYRDEALAGFLSYKVIDQVMDIHRVAVHPQHFRQGIAQKLLDHVEGLEKSVHKIIVATGKDNAPAVKLYQKNGFTKIDDIEIGEGVFLSQFEKCM